MESQREGDALLARAISRAHWALLWERLWPALAAPATAIGLFLAVSWLGFWLWLPPVARAIGLCAFALLVVAALERYNQIFPEDEFLRKMLKIAKE